MSHWNYRVTRRELAGEVEFAIREVYYGPECQIGWTVNPAPPTGENLDEVRSELGRMLEATMQPVIDITDENNPKEVA